mgnify:FL=1
MFFDNMYSDPGLTMKRSKKEEISDCNDPGKLSVRMTQKLSDADVSSLAEIQETLRLFSPYPDLDITLPKIDQFFHKHLYCSRIISDKLP